MWQFSIKYPVVGFERTASWSWVSSHDPLTSVPALTDMVLSLLKGFTAKIVQKIVNFLSRRKEVPISSLSFVHQKNWQKQLFYNNDVQTFFISSQPMG